MFSFCSCRGRRIRALVRLQTGHASQYKGAMTEAISDPWLERKQGFEWQGNPYTSEMVSDLMLQLIEMGYVNPSGELKKSK